MWLLSALWAWVRAAALPISALSCGAVLASALPGIYVNTTPNWNGEAQDPLGSVGSTTLSSLVSTAARRLEGDYSYAIWSHDELVGLAQTGYEQFCALTKALWDSRHIPDRHSPTPTTDEWSRADAPASSRTWETFVESQNRPTSRRATARYAENVVLVSDPTPFLGDSRQDARQAGEYGTITAGIDAIGASGTAPNPDSVLPVEVSDVERVTYDGRRLQALTPVEADRIDRQWERYTGYPSAFALRQEGGRKLLKRFRGPAAPADSRPYNQETGILRGGEQVSDVTTSSVLAQARITLTPFSLQSSGVALGLVSTFYPYPIRPTTLILVFDAPTVVGWVGLTEFAGYWATGSTPYGFARRVDGVHFTGAPYGIPRRYNPGTQNTRLDYTRKAPKLTAQGRLEIQDWDARYVLFFVLARAYAKDCPGQNKKAAEHYQKRWEIGVEQVRQRWASVREGLEHVMGTGPTHRDNNPVAELPWQYGRN